MVLENGKITNLMKFKIQPIKSDASFRKFYRINLNKNSKIIVFAEKEKYKNLIVYCTINNFLRNNKILAPKLFEHNYTKSVMIIEDFGDLTFNKVLSVKKDKLIIYKKLVDLLLKIQKIRPKEKLRTISSQLYVINKYSMKHLHQESDLFLNWYLPMVLNKKKVLSIRLRIKKSLSKLYKNSHSEAFYKALSFNNLNKTNLKLLYKSYIQAVVQYQAASITGNYQLRSNARTEEDMQHIATIEQLEQDIVSLSSQIKKTSQLNEKVQLNVQIKNKRDKIQEIKTLLNEH